MSPLAQGAVARHGHVCTGARTSPVPGKWHAVLRRACAGLVVCSVASAWAQASAVCQRPPELGAAEQDRLIQVAALLKAELDATGQHVAIVARSGQGAALQRLGHRYSHAGVSLQASANAPWSVRQLYLACDEQRPRIYDQGLPGFVMATNDPADGYLSVLLLPPEAAAALEATALDDAKALQLLGTGYSANAYALGTQYQNCNQWLAELLATAWHTPPDPVTAGNRDDTAPRTLPPTQNARQHAQHGLARQGYRPSVLAVRWPPLMWAAALLPWFHVSDHPADDLAAGQFRVSMPASIAEWVHTRWPEATHWELCHTAQHVVIRRGGAPIAPGCVPEAGDDIRLLDGKESSLSTNKINS